MLHQLISASEKWFCVFVVIVSPPNFYLKWVFVSQCIVILLLSRLSTQLCSGLWQAFLPCGSIRDRKYSKSESKFFFFFFPLKFFCMLQTHTPPPPTHPKKKWRYEKKFFHFGMICMEWVVHKKNNIFY